MALPLMYPPPAKPGVLDLIEFSLTNDDWPLDQCVKGSLAKQDLYLPSLHLRDIHLTNSDQTFKRQVAQASLSSEVRLQT